MFTAPAFFCSLKKLSFNAHSARPPEPRGRTAISISALVKRIFKVSEKALSPQIIRLQVSRGVLVRTVWLLAVEDMKRSDEVISALMTADHAGCCPDICTNSLFVISKAQRQV